MEVIPPDMYGQRSSSRICFLRWCASPAPVRKLRPHFGQSCKRFTNNISSMITCGVSGVLHLAVATIESCSEAKVVLLPRDRLCLKPSAILFRETGSELGAVCASGGPHFGGVEAWMDEVASMVEVWEEVFDNMGLVFTISALSEISLHMDKSGVLTLSRLELGCWDAWAGW